MSTLTDALSVGDPESQETVGQLRVSEVGAPLRRNSNWQDVLGKSMDAIANALPFPAGP